jgi:hypothetical protein
MTDAEARRSGKTELPSPPRPRLQSMSALMRGGKAGGKAPGSAHPHPPSHYDTRGTGKRGHSEGSEGSEAS